MQTPMQTLISTLTTTYPPPIGDSAFLSETDLAASLQQAFREHDPDHDIWLFGYGSLIWNPGLPVEESAAARVNGYHRGLYMWSRHNRGTPEQPGLVLAVDRGGSCPGVAFRLAAKGSEHHLVTLWRREMSMGEYRPAWLPCKLADGRLVRALCFVIRRDSSAYAGRLPDDIVRRVFRDAHGHYGTTLEYVEKTVAALNAGGIPDRALESLLLRCRPDASYGPTPAESCR
jgi:cation transport protein ChaC